jgi:hypothetical protein
VGARHFLGCAIRAQMPRQDPAAQEGRARLAEARCEHCWQTMQTSRSGTQKPSRQGYQFNEAAVVVTVGAERLHNDGAVNPC